MATEFEIRAAAKAAMPLVPGMGEFTARAVACAVIETVDRMRGMAAALGDAKDRERAEASRNICGND